MNPFYRFYCRAFQTVFKLALPILPYRDPKILEKLTDIPTTLKREGKKHPLIVTDRTLFSLGLPGPLLDAMDNAAMPYTLYAEVEQNPTTDHVSEAYRRYRENGCDCIVAFGGGSSMDCAKATGVLCVRRVKEIGHYKGILRVWKKLPLLIAVPTTAGTGSETTLAAVIVDAKTRHKYAVNDFPLIPRYAVLDASVTRTLPFSVVTTTGMDAMTHAVEAYIGRSGNRSTRKDAVDAVKRILDNLEKASYASDEVARQNMLLAAHKAGRAFSKAYVGYVHAVAHTLGGCYNTPHGLANAVLMPIVLRAYGVSAHRKLASLALECNVGVKGASDAENAERMIVTIEKLNEKLRIPKKLSGIREEDFVKLADYAFHEGNPLYPVPELWDRERFIDILRQVKG